MSGRELGVQQGYWGPGKGLRVSEGVGGSGRGVGGA